MNGISKTSSIRRCMGTVVILFVLIMGLTATAAAERVSYPVIGGNIYFDTATGTITDCDATVTSAVIPAEINGVAVTSIGERAFGECENLTAIELPAGLTSIGDFAFSGCSSLVELHLPAALTAIGERAFVVCDSLTNFTVDPANRTYCSEDGVLYTKNMDTLVCYPAAKTGSSFSVPSSVTKIGNSSFCGCGSLMEIDLPAGLTAIEDWAFASCSALANMEIPAGVTVIGEAAFVACTSLTDVTLPAALTTIELGAFMACDKLENIEFPVGLTTIGDLAFSLCRDLTTVEIPAGVTSIGMAAFASCSSLTTIAVDPANEAYCSVDGVLYTKAMDTLLCYPAGKTANSFSVPDSVTTIAAYGFYSGNLVEIRLPVSLTAVGDYAFDFNTNLTTVYYAGTQEQWNAITIGTNNEPLTNADIRFGQESSAAPVLPAPALSVSNSAATGKITLSWTAVEGAEQYEIWVSSSENGTYTRLGAVAQTKTTHSSAAAGETYYYKVRAVTGDVTGAFSAIVGRTCDLARPAVTITNKAASGKPVLSWDAVPGASKYTIYVSDSKNGTYSALGTVTGTTAVHNSAEVGKTYYYRVKAIHAANSGANSAASAAVGKTCDLPRPVVSITLNENEKPVLSWKAVAGAIRYEIYRATSVDGVYTRIGAVTGTSVVNSKVEFGVTYYYRVKAIFSDSAANSANSFTVAVTVE